MLRSARFNKLSLTAELWGYCCFASLHGSITNVSVLCCSCYSSEKSLFSLKFWPFACWSGPNWTLEILFWIMDLMLWRSWVRREKLHVCMKRNHVHHIGFPFISVFLMSPRAGTSGLVRNSQQTSGALCVGEALLSVWTWPSLSVVLDFPG